MTNYRTPKELKAYHKGLSDGKRRYSFGDICDSRYWISFESRYWANWRWGLYFGPTYNGTVAGFCLSLPFAVVIGHVRDLHAFDKVKP